MPEKYFSPNFWEQIPPTPSSTPMSHWGAGAAIFALLTLDTISDCATVCKLCCSSHFALSPDGSLKISDNRPQPYIYLRVNVAGHPHKSE